jgi:hypothetical protein
VSSRLAALVVVASFAAAAGLGGCSDDDGDLAAFCAAATDTTRFRTLFDDLEPGDVTGSLATFQAAHDAEERLRDDAPEAVRPDIDVLARFFADLVAGLEAADPASGERPEIYDQLRPRFDQVEAASGRIGRYVDANC